MGSGVTIGKEVLDEIRADAAGSREEVCGLLFGTTDVVTGAARCRNVAADPKRMFEIDPAAAHRFSPGYE